MDEDSLISSPEAVPPSVASTNLLFDLLFDLSLLQEKIHLLQSSLSSFPSTDIAITAAAGHAGALVNDIISGATSILFALQQLSHYTHVANTRADDHDHDHSCHQTHHQHLIGDVVELDASVLLAKHTHSCHVCGKGFRRDANLRMHMRAHGDEYKTRAALAKTDSSNSSSSGSGFVKKYSCPQEGCRWNAKHDKFHPLKSVACAKNHYKRSHCPKLYVCSRCGIKDFAVLSDLRSHEKHCGNPRWRCTCGTTFSRKDKLVGHVALFFGHSPAPAMEGAHLL